MMRSAAKAIACRPDEQKRLIGDGRRRDRNAGAQAGDARDVQSLFGLRHRAARESRRRSPPGRAPGARRSASPIDGGRQIVGPRAAQRAVRRLADRGPHGRDDDGSCMFMSCPASRDSTSRLTSRPADPRPRRRPRLDLAVEQVIGAVDDHQLLRLRGARVELAHVLQRADLVEFAVNEKLRLRARRDRLRSRSCRPAGAMPSSSETRGSSAPTVSATQAPNDMPAAHSGAAWIALVHEVERRRESRPSRRRRRRSCRRSCRRRGS